MRDIRSDLKDRAHLLQEQIKAAQTRFNELMEQLKGEHDNRCMDLRAELNAVTTLMGIEHRRLSGAPSGPKAQPQLQPQGTEPTQLLSDFLIRKLNDVGAMSEDELRHVSIHESYFADGDGAGPSVHAALIQVAKAGLVRQLPNGKFVPTAVMNTTRTRRAI